MAQGLVVTAASDDSVIQAVETTSAGWALGVQFHPEENADDDRLFAALITAAQQPVRAH
nr:gamma-glutamyl-gamma-aminobutyrate hydrolase family protein [Ornithinimicrobium sp. INDO-MA30-4]